MLVIGFWFGLNVCVSGFESSFYLGFRCGWNSGLVWVGLGWIGWCVVLCVLGIIIVILDVVWCCLEWCVVVFSGVGNWYSGWIVCDVCDR